MVVRLVSIVSSKLIQMLPRTALKMSSRRARPSVARDKRYHRCIIFLDDSARWWVDCWVCRNDGIIIEPNVAWVIGIVGVIDRGVFIIDRRSTVVVSSTCRCVLVRLAAS